MGFDNSFQLLLFLYSLIFGIALGAVYTGLSAFRLFKSPSAPALFFADFLYFFVFRRCVFCVCVCFLRRTDSDFCSVDCFYRLARRISDGGKPCEKTYKKEKEENIIFPDKR